MKNNLCFLVLSILLFSCNSKEKKQETTARDSSINTILRDSTSQLKDVHYFWAADERDSKGISMKKTRPVSSDSLTAASMLAMLNNTYPEIPLALLRTSGDTIFLKIDKSNYLNKQTGSTGAEVYLAEVTYNLTELSGINYVDIRFKQGDHAEPGTYTRTDFVKEGK